MIYTTQEWLAEVAKLEKLAPGQRRRPDYYTRILRDFVECGFLLATERIADAYFALVDYRPDEYGGAESDWLEMVQDETYSKALCQMVQILDEGRYYGYATHVRSEDVFEAINKCFDRFEHEGQQVWLMPVDDNEEMISLTFEFVVGDEDTVVKTLETAKLAAQLAMTKPEGGQE